MTGRIYRDLKMSSSRQAAELAVKEPPVAGVFHLHYRLRDGEAFWIVRRKKNELCGTARCQIVLISGYDEPCPGCDHPECPTRRAEREQQNA